MRQYLDTSALIALGDKRDKNHEAAKAYLSSSIEGGTRFVMGRNVLIEYIDGVTKRIGKEKGVEELDNLVNSKLLVVEENLEKDWSKAVEYFKQYKDKKIDLTDCLSFSLMERLELDTVFTFDSDFKVKFTIVP
jgi:hypothetical protein